jgi:hypothetical protein
MKTTSLGPLLQLGGALRNIWENHYDHESGMYPIDYLTDRLVADDFANGIPAVLYFKHRYAVRRIWVHVWDAPQDLPGFRRQNDSKHAFPGAISDTKARYPDVFSLEKNSAALGIVCITLVILTEIDSVPAFLVDPTEEESGGLCGILRPIAAKSEPSGP